MSGRLEELTEWHAFTDGACKGNPGPGGWAAVIIGGGRLIEIGGAENPTTNNRMEMTAAAEALKRIPRGEKTILRTDSSYLINGITKWIHGWKRNGWKKQDGEDVLNADLWRALDSLNGRHVEWRLVPGHAGHHLNERCDEIAVELSRKKHIKLRNIPVDKAEDYLDIHEIIIEGKEKNRAPGTGSSKSFGKKPSGGGPKKYIFAHNGQVYLFKSWPECKAFTDGRPGYPKSCASRAEELEYLKKFGLDERALDRAIGR